MKKIFLPFLLNFFFMNLGYAQCTWEPVGINDTSLITRHGGIHASVVFDKFDSIYSVYSDIDLGKRLTVKKYGNGAWKTLGTEGFTSGWAAFNSMAVNDSGVPYVAYVDNANAKKATVMRFNGTSWTYVGVAGFSDSAAANTTLAFDSIGTPYVAYKDRAHGGKATVKYFNGTSWINVGPAGFTPDSVLTPFLKVSKEGIPHLAFQDPAHAFKASMMYYNGNAWTYLGSAGFTPSTASQTSFAFDSLGIPYVAFCYVDSSKAAMMKYNGTSWILYSKSGIPAITPYYLSMAVSASGVPYLAYNASQYYTLVWKFNGVKWVKFYYFFGNGSGSMYASIAISAAGDAVFAYCDSWNDYSPTVLKLVQGEWESLSHPGIVPTGAGGQGIGNQNKILVDGLGTPYFANAGSNSVMKYTGGNWTYVGNKGDVGGNWMSMCFDPQQNPCLAYEENNALKVKKFDGTTWNNVGSIGSFLAPIEQTDLICDSSGNFFVNSRPPIWPGYDVSRILKFNGTTWDTLGGTIQGEILKIGFTPLGEPMVISSVWTDSTRLHALRFNGTSWTIIGTPGTVPMYPSSTPEMRGTISKSGSAYAFYAGLYGAMKFDGSAWSFIGGSSLNFGGFGVVFPSIVTDTNGVPYVTGNRYGGGGVSYPMTVFKFDGTNWVNTGPIISDFSPQQGTSIAIDPTTNTPYVTFGSYCPFVKKLVCVDPTASEVNIPTAITEVTLYPNPASLAVIVTSGTAKLKSLRVFNLLGEELRNQIVSGSKSTLNLVNFLPGIYLVEVITDEGRVLKKLVIE